MNTDALPFTVAWFGSAGEKGKPALGDPEHTTWGEFASIFGWRREGEKDGPCFVPSRFKIEEDGRHVRRKNVNLLTRSGIALDIEMNKKTGEVPPTPEEAISRLKGLGLAGLLYSSHDHRPGDIRYRVVMPMTTEIAHDLPAPEIMADRLGVRGVLDESKIGAASLFYLPSCPYDAPDVHQTVVIPGAPIDAAWVAEAAGALLASRQAEADRIADEARSEAAARRDAKIAAGFNPDDSLIEKLRSRFDLESVLISHGYAKAGTKYRHPNSSSGCFGADIANLGGIDRVFSHNATDPLHESNLPSWCDVTAIDAFDATVILDFGGDRTRAMRELAERFGLAKAAQRKALSRLLFRLIKQQAPQGEIEKQAMIEGRFLGLDRDEIRQVSVWVIDQATGSRKAA